MEEDKLKGLFQSMPTAEPPHDLRSKILSSIDEKNWQTENLWLKPAVVLCSFLMVTLLGTFASLTVATDAKNNKPASSFTRWARTTPSNGFVTSRQTGGLYK